MNIYRKEDTVYIHLRDEVSFYNVIETKRAVYNFLKDSDRMVIINLSKVSFMDSAGLGLIISIYKRLMEHDGKLVIEYPQLGVQKLLEMTRIDRIIDIKKTTEPTTGSWSEVQ